jgi:hypothetical protein
MTKKQVKAVCDFSHDVIMKLKAVSGCHKKTPSLLCHSLAHLNASTWLARVTANGIINDYIVKR